MGVENGVGAAETTVELVEVVDPGGLAMATEGRTPLTDPTLAYLASLAPKSRATMVERLKGMRQDWERDSSRGQAQHASPHAQAAVTRPGSRPAGSPTARETADVVPPARRPRPSSYVPGSTGAVPRRPGRSGPLTQHSRSRAWDSSAA